jgi:predicted GH43/DUF377 family glycosyl hydrolase
MSVNLDRDILKRSGANPLVTLSDLSFHCSDICNAAVTRFKGQYLLLITIETLEGFSVIHKAHSEDSLHFVVDRTPCLAPLPQDLCEYESLGVRDPRITYLDDTYYITYVAESDIGWRIALARTDDFIHFERLGMISQPDSKNGILFPEKINGKYALLERPIPGASIWMNFSQDLRYWGEPQVVMTPRGGFWDGNRIGAAFPPVKIEEGWLLVYYGKKSTSAGPLVRLGVAILDREEPWKVIARSNIPILSPRERYERIGDVGNLVFSCGAFCTEDGVMNLYYGASDSCICLGQAPIRDLVEVCWNHGKEAEHA